MEPNLEHSLNSLTFRQEQAIIGLLMYPSVKQAALYAGVPLRTLVRWRSTPVFQEAVAAARARARAQSESVLAEHNRSALECLRTILSDETQPSMTRVMAARTLMRYANEYIGLRTTFEKSCDRDQAFDGTLDDAVTRALEQFRDEHNGGSDRLPWTMPPPVQPIENTA